MPALLSLFGLRLSLVNTPSSYSTKNFLLDYFRIKKLTPSLRQTLQGHL